ncbi:MAG: DsbA family protein [Hyphomicrobiaceae bacterium]
MSTPTPNWATTRHFLYVADPLCSWCYGFAPVISAITKHFDDRLPLRLVMGGLRAGNTRPMRDDDKAYIRNAWTKVGGTTGRPFDTAFFDRDGFIYDTEPVCRAVVTVREWPEQAPVSPLTLKDRLSSAFYAHNRDVTDPSVLADIAAEAGFDRQAFFDRLQSPDMRNLTFRDFLTSQQMGVEGFPMLAAGTEQGGYALITHGYRPIDGLIEGVESWLANGAPVTAAN